MSRTLSCFQKRYFTLFVDHTGLLERQILKKRLIIDPFRMGFFSFFFYQSSFIFILFLKYLFETRWFRVAHNMLFLTFSVPTPWFQYYQCNIFSYHCPPFPKLPQTCPLTGMTNLLNITC